MSERRTVLVVDDDEEIVLGMTLRLQAAGYEAISAADGQEGLTVAVERRPDAIVLDVRMPRMDGLETIRQLRRREQTRHIPVVMVSASLQDKRPALEAGARFYLSKPCRGMDIVAAIEAAVREPTPICFEV